MESVIPCEPNGSRDSLLSPTDSQQAVDYRDFCYNAAHEMNELTNAAARRTIFYENARGILQATNDTERTEQATLTHSHTDHTDPSGPNRPHRLPRHLPNDGSA